MTAHFATLRAARGDNPLFLMEHELAPADLDQLMVAVRSCLARYNVSDPWWERHPLPLLIAATEVGYVYRGTGTDFWPIFASRLGETLPLDRAALSNLFRRVATPLGLAEPASTAWNAAFCHIAWPIHHAILPLELHQPLARTLRDVRSHLDLAGSDAALIGPIRNRARVAGGLRLIAWLEDLRVAAAVIRQFLRPTSDNTLAPSALERIARDLGRDEIARTALREARKRQDALEARPARRSRRGTAEPELRYAPLVLRSLDQRLSLAVKLPQLEPAAREQARGALDAIRWRALLWSRGRPVPSRNIFSDYPVPLSVEALPSSDTPLLADLAGLPLSQDAKDFLGSLRVQSAVPMLFSDLGPDGEATQRAGMAAADSSRCIVLLEPGAAPLGVGEHLGRVAGLVAVRVDPSTGDGAALLERFGIEVRRAPSLTWVGDAELERHRPVRRFRAGDYVGFDLRVPEGKCEACLITPDGSRSILEADRHLLAGFAADQLGTYALHYGAGERLSFDVVAAEEPAEFLAVDVDGGTGAIGDLAEREVTLRFDSVAPIQEAELELTLVCDGRIARRARDVLPDTPCRITGEHPIWAALFGADGLERLWAARSADLRIAVPGLVDVSYRFEQVTAPFEWRHDSAGRLVAADEAGDLAVYTASPERPLDIAPVGSADTGDDVRLFRAGHDAPQQAGGLCIGPRIWRPADAATARTPERLLRQFSGGRADAPDGRSVIDALIGWAAAGVDHPVTQFRRGQIVRQLERWMLEQLCGAEWVKREAELGSEGGASFRASFLAACACNGVGYATLDLSARLRDLLDRVLQRLIEARALPVTLEASREPIDEDVGIAFDTLFNDAYATVYDAVVAVGDDCPFDPDEDIDVGEPSEAWDAALRAAAKEALHIRLVDLLRPLDGGDALSLADFETMLPEEVVGLLHGWIGRHRPQHLARAWNPDLVEAAFWLLAKPRVAARLPWRSAAERLLADRFTARAIRYAALRARVGAVASADEPGR